MRVQVSLGVFRYPLRHPHANTDIVAMQPDGHWYGGTVEVDKTGVAPPYVDTGIEGVEMQEGTMWFYVDDVRNWALTQFDLALRYAEVVPEKSNTKEGSSD